METLFYHLSFHQFSLWKAYSVYIIKKKFWLITVVSLAWPVAGVSSEISGQASEDVVKVRPIGGLAGIATATIQWKILELALQKSGRPYDLALSSHRSQPARIADQMRELGTEGNIIWTGPTNSQSAEMRPIEIPILFGLQSYKYLWVRTTDAQILSHVRTVDDLKKFPLLIGQNWVANHILEAEGFELRKGAASNLPKMLMAGRGDVLFWPVPGVFNMYEKFGVKDMDMIPAPNILVRLPQVLYFWVTDDESSQALFDTVTLGLHTAIADGSLDQLIRAFPRVGDAYTDLVSNDFFIIDIDNPDLSEKVKRNLEINGVKVGERK